MKKYFSYMLLAVILISCGGGSDNPVNNDDLEDPTTTSTKVLTDDNITNDLISISNDSTQIIISSELNSELNLTANDILMIPQDEGMLKKITSIQTSGNQVVLTTTDAALTEAVEEGSAEIEQTLSAANLNKILYQLDGVELDTTQIGKVNGAGIFININSVIYDADGSNSTINDRITLNGSITITPKYKMRLSIRGYSLQSMLVEYEINEQMNLSVSVGLFQLFSREFEKIIASYKFPTYKVMIGYLPFWVTPQLDLIAGAEIGLAGSLETGITQNLTYTVGMEYANGVWSNYKENSQSINFTPPTLSAGLETKFYVEPLLKLKMYSLVGPYMSAKLYGEFDADLLDDPWWSLYGGIDVGAGILMKVLSRTIVDFGYEFINYRVELAHASSSPTPLAPVLQSPSNNSTGLELTQTLSWLASDGATSYKLNVADNNSFTNAVVDQSGIATNSFELSGLDFSTKYYWRVIATNENGNSHWSSIWNFTTQDRNDPPAQPNDPFPEDDAEDVPTNTTLGWDCTDPEGDPLSYDLYFGTTATPELIEENYGSKSYYLDPLTNGQKYYWKVVAHDNKGNITEGELWEFITVSLPGPEPDTPSNPSPADNSTNVSTQPTLEWECTDPNGDPLTFDVYFGTEPSSALADENRVAKSFHPETLLPSQTYYWKITAKDDNGNQTEGVVWQFTTSAVSFNWPPTIPTSPHPADERNDVSTNTYLSWSASDSDQDPLTYDVYFGTAANPSLLASDVTEPYYRPDEIDDHRNYYWKIVAKDDHGNETEGPVWHFTTDNHDYEINLDWVVVPAGDFTYGENDEVRTINYNYQIQKFEVTQAEYVQYLNAALAAGEIKVWGSWAFGYYSGDTKWEAGEYAFALSNSQHPNYPDIYPVQFDGSQFSYRSGYGDHPVVNVTWFGANAFAQFFGYDLPNEEEWEKAARGNTGWDYPWGDDIDYSRANYWDGASQLYATKPVGYYNGSNQNGFQTTDSPSPFGAYDMAGNVSEWVESFFGGSYPDNKVLRGGNLGGNGAMLKCWIRRQSELQVSSIFRGFRCSKRD